MTWKARRRPSFRCSMARSSAKRWSAREAGPAEPLQPRHLGVEVVGVDVEVNARRKAGEPGAIVVGHARPGGLGVLCAARVAGLANWRERAALGLTQSRDDRQPPQWRRAAPRPATAFRAYASPHRPTRSAPPAR